MRKLNIQTKSEPPAVYDRWLFSVHIGFSHFTEDVFHYFLGSRHLALADLVYGRVGILAGFRNGLLYLALDFFFTYAVLSCNTFEYIVVFHSISSEDSVLFLNVYSHDLRDICTVVCVAVEELLGDTVICEEAALLQVIAVELAAYKNQL